MWDALEWSIQRFFSAVSLRFFGQQSFGRYALGMQIRDSIAGYPIPYNILRYFRISKHLKGQLWPRVGDKNEHFFILCHDGQLWPRVGDGQWALSHSSFWVFSVGCWYGGTSIKALELRQYITYKVCIKVLLRRFFAQYWVRMSFSLSKELIVWFGKFWRVCKILIPLEYMAPVLVDILIEFEWVKGVP